MLRRLPSSVVLVSLLWVHGSLCAALASARVDPASRLSGGGAKSLPVTGSVATSDGRPIEAARVVLLPVLDAYREGMNLLAFDAIEPEGGRGLSMAATPTDASVASTDPAGRFRVSAPHRGLWRVRVEADGFVAMQTQVRAILGAVELAPLFLHRDLGAVLRVRDPRGRPHPGLLVAARASRPARWRSSGLDGWVPADRLRRADAEGMLELPRADGESLAVASRPVRRAGTGWDGTVGGVLVMEDDRADLVLEVRDARGQPAAGVLVRGGPQRWPIGATDGQGRAALRLPPAGDVEVMLEAADGRRTVHVVGSPRADARVIRLDLPPPRTLAGRVTGVQGRPLGGALVYAPSEPGRWVWTDAEGRYRLPWPAAQGRSLVVRAAGHVPRLRPVALAEIESGRGPAVSLERAVQARGRVADATGMGLSGVHVELVAVDAPSAVVATQVERAVVRASTDDGGEFRLAGLQTGVSYRVVARRTGHLPKAHDFVARAGTVDLGHLTLTPARAGFGLVLDDREQPVAGARVVVSDASRPRRDPRLVPEDDPSLGISLDDGRFRVAAVPGTRVDLDVTAPGYTPLRIGGIDLPEGEGATDLGTVLLLPGQAVAGRVRDLDDGAVAGARIHVFAGDIPSARLIGRVDDGLSARPPAAVTDAAGRFVVEDRPPGSRVHVAVIAAGYVVAWHDHVPVPSPEPLEVVLEPAAALVGTVEDEAGIPLVGAAVQAVQVDRQAETGLPLGLPRTRHARTDAAGRFALDGLEPGTVEVYAQAEGYVLAEPQSIRLPGDSMRFVLARGQALQGVARLADGRPAADVRIVAGDAAGHSDADGTFRLTGLAEGAVTVVGHHAQWGVQRQSIEIEPGVNEVTLTFEPGVVVEGVATDEADLPVVAASVSLQRDGDHGPQHYDAMTDADGRFALDGVVPGTYRLHGTAAGFADATVASIVVAAERVKAVDVRFQAALRVTGALRGLDPAELANVEVAAHGPEARHRRGVVRYDGSYSVEGLAPGRWSVVAQTSGGTREARVRVALEPAAGDAAVDLVFERGLVLSGQVLLGGEPLPATRVGLDGLDRSRVRHTVADAEGRFHIEGLEPGGYRLRIANARARVVHNERLELQNDRSLHLDLRLATLRGHVADRRGEAVSEALVTLRRRVDGAGAADFVITAASAADGRFVLPRVPPGAYTLSADKDGYGPVSRLLTVEAEVDRDGLELTLEPTAGLAVRARLSTGAIPPRVRATLLDHGGQPTLRDQRATDAEGLVTLPRVPPGTWAVAFSAPGAQTLLQRVTVPGEPLDIVFEPAATLALELPDLALDDLTARAHVSRDGQPFVPLDDPALAAGWPVVQGQVAIGGLAPGPWTVEVVAADGRRWLVEAVASTRPRRGPPKP